MTRRERISYSIVAAACLVIATTASSAWYHRVGEPAKDERPRPISYAPGRQILFVYIGSEECGFSREPGFDEIVRTAQMRVGQQARANKQAFSSLGVSAGQSSRLGIEYLERYGPFDEVISGRGFLNTAAMRYFFDEFAGEASFPQILVIQRDLSYLKPGYTYRNERVLLRAVGLPQIEKWVQDNAPIS